MCYRTVSYVVVAVVASVPPHDLLTKEWTDVYGGLDRTLARGSLLQKRQEEWEIAKTGRWTFTLIGDIRAWKEAR